MTTCMTSLSGSKTTFIFGHVCRGQGLATEDLVEDVRLLRKRLNEPFIDGTLNVISQKPFWLLRKTAVFVSPKRRYFWPAELNGVDVLLFRWDKCPPHAMELLSTVHLRDALRLEDHTPVRLTIRSDFLTDHPSLRSKRIVWNLFWCYRVGLFYRTGPYRSMVRNTPVLRRVNRYIAGVV